MGEWIWYSLEAVVVEDTGADVVGRLTAAPKGVAEIEDIMSNVSHIQKKKKCSLENDLFDLILYIPVNNFSVSKNIFCLSTSTV